MPLDVSLETKLDPAIVPWLAFARQKLAELGVLATGLREGRDAIAHDLAANAAVLAARSRLAHRERVGGARAQLGRRERPRAPPERLRRAPHASECPARLAATADHHDRLVPSDLDAARGARRPGRRRIDAEEYEAMMRQEIADVITLQEELGLDVLVHGEPERNDMVQYFAEQLDGYIATVHGWVQSYGSRYVRPPIIVGDVSRPHPMTVRWTTYAQSLTERPVKGMLTGPVTMLAWSFVRDDQPLGETARQVALALRDEVVDLEAAGTAVIQVDEPALRETLPLRQSDRAAYLAWAVEAFRLTTSGVRDDTQIHTHMCYADFGDVLNAIIEMDADVISLEAARSEMAIVEDLSRAHYRNEIGPGVWDIHSPRVPSVEEIAGYVKSAATVVAADRLWINPDCGLKTRGYPEVKATLSNLVEATRRARADL